METIQNISNIEQGSSVRTKLNKVIDRINKTVQTLKVFYTDNQSGEIGDNSMFEYLVPANTLSNPGDRLEFKGVITDSYDTRFRMFFGGLPYFDTVDINFSDRLYLEIQLVRVEEDPIVRGWIKYQTDHEFPDLQTVFFSLSPELDQDQLFQITGHHSTQPSTARLGELIFKPGI